MKHPISEFEVDGKLDFDSLYDQLEEEVNNGNINRKENGTLVLYDYSRECQFKGEWNSATRIARGLILEPSTKSIIALPLPKFFNYGDEQRQHGLPIGEPRWKDSEILEKMDGSCGICYYYDGRWQVATRGSFDSDQAIWATKWLHDKVVHSTMAPQLTYVFEIIYHENQIVVDYDFEGLVLLTVTHLEALVEAGSEAVDLIAEEMGVARPISYKFDKISDVVSMAKTLPKDEEGYVIRFSSGTRVKIKGDEYCRIHKILAHHSPLVVWENLRDQGPEFITEYKLNIPEEFWDETDQWVSYFEGCLLRISCEVRSNSVTIWDYSDKDLGLALPDMDIPEHVKGFLFSYRKNPCPSFNTGKPCVLFDVGEKARKKVFDIFKPVGNVIPCL